MPELVCELIVSFDHFARGQRSPGYFGYFGPDIEDWITTNTAIPHRVILGRRTYEALAGHGLRLPFDQVLDRRVLLLEYHPAGARPYAG